METSLPVVACSLSAADQRDRMDEWRSLLARAESREPLSTGMRYRFPLDLTEDVRALAAAEQECCSFLRFDLTQADNSLVLTVESEGAGQDALRFIFA
jgi:hypothetical protein